jgi:predicted lipoprotein with Yx(FWY)xxD motif
MRASVPTLALTALLALVALPAASGRVAAASAGAVVKTAYNKTVQKTILVDSRGRTLYLFTAETNGTPACTNDSTYHCSKAWPPLTTTGAPVAGKGVKASLLGTASRDDGTTQVTYRHHPLYRFAHDNSGSGIPGDRKPGDAHGQGFLRLWYVVSPAGKAIH